MPKVVSIVPFNAVWFGHQ